MNKDDIIYFKINRPSTILWNLYYMDGIMYYDNIDNMLPNVFDNITRDSEYKD